MQQASSIEEKQKCFRNYIEQEIIPCIKLLNLVEEGEKSENANKPDQSTKPARFEYIPGFKQDAWKSFWICDHALLKKLDSNKISQLESFEEITSYFNYEKTIFGNPELENFKIDSRIPNANAFYPYHTHAATNKEGGLYYSKEMIKLIYTEKVNFDHLDIL
jgi:hypothetical protein